jgi:hypothetical protein
MFRSLIVKLWARARAHRALRVGLIGAVTFFMAFGLVAGLWLPGYAKTKAQELLTDRLGRPVTIGELSISPYTLSATVRDIRVGEPGQQRHALVIGSAYFNLSSASLFALAPVFQEIRIEQPQVSLARFADGRLSIADVVERLTSQAAENGAPEGEAAFQFAVYNMSLSQGRIVIDDQLKKRQHEISDLEIGVPFISNFPSNEDIWVEPRISAQVNGAPFAIEGEASMFGEAKKMTLRVDLKNLSLAGIEAYADLVPGVAITKAALSSLLEISFVQEPRKAPEIIVAGAMAIRGIDLSVTLPQTPWQLSTQNLDLELEALDLRLPQLAQKSRIGKATISAAAGRISLRDTSLPRVAPFEVSEPRIALENIALSGESAATLTLSSLVNRKGRLDVSGEISGWQKAPDSLRADLKVKATDVEIVAFQHLAQERLGKTLLTNGAVGADVQIRVRGSQATFAGDAELANLNLLERETNSEILSWKRLQATGIVLVLDPFQLQLRALVLDRPVTRLVLRENGELNFAALAAPEAQQPTPIPLSNRPLGPQKAQDSPIVIQSLTVRNADVFFVDRFTKPNFQASLTEITGTLAPLRAGSPGAIDIRGKVNKSAPLVIAGTVDPFSSRLFLDMRVVVQGADLPPVSPYSIRHFAYPIERGKLSLDLSYKVKDRALESQNRIRLDQLTLGPKTESPDALSIPLGLVVALLKNSRGEIDIDLPVGGSLDDPQFSVAGLVFKAFINLLVKAVTSPFALLGSLFGEGADLSKVDFLPGSSQLTGDSEKTLEHLAKALTDRPALRLEIAATVNLAQEQEAIAKAKLSQQLKARRLAELARTGKPAGSLAEITLSAADYQRLLTDAYKAAPFEKPRNLIGMVKAQPVEEMQAQLIQHMTLRESDSVELATLRGQAVRDWLLAKGVSASQLFVIAPRIDAQGLSQAPGQALFSMSP